MSNLPEQADYNPFAFIALAESYGSAAFTVKSGPRLPHEAPVGMLAAHCMEVALKAVMLANGATPEDLKRIGHNLRKLLMASNLDWSDLDQDAVAFFGDAMNEHAFR